MLDQWTCAGGIVTDVIFLYVPGWLLVLPLVVLTFLHSVTINLNMCLYKLANRTVTEDLLVTDLFFFIRGPLGVG